MLLEVVEEENVQKKKRLSVMSDVGISWRGRDDSH